MAQTEQQLLVLWVNSLALNFKSNLLYWCDASFDLIDLQGNNYRVVVLTHLISITIHLGYRCISERTVPG